MPVEQNAMHYATLSVPWYFSPINNRMKEQTWWLPSSLHFENALRRPHTPHKAHKPYLSFFRRIKESSYRCGGEGLLFPLTPTPLKSRHTRLNTNPNFPSTNLFTNPKARTDRGTVIANGVKEALSLSSGNHIPPRFLRHLITVWSEIRPTMTAPTERV